MGTIFDKWDSAIDTAGLQEDIAEAEKNGGSGDYREVPVGSYEVKVEKMEIKECGSEKNAGSPMVSIWFRIISGEFENSIIFYNQLITQGFQIHQVNNLLRSMCTGLNIEFKNYGQYNQLLLDVLEEVDGKLEYLLDYGQNKKGYHTYEIEEVYDVE